MRVLHAIIGVWHRVVGLFRRPQLGREIDDELSFHLAMREADHARHGRPDAARAARREFGNVAVLREQVRDMWTFPSLESFWQDIRYALRALRKSPAFTIVALAVLAIGIGATTAMFSLVDAMFLRGLPYPDADRLVVLIGNVQRTAVERRGNSYPDHLDWRAKSASFVDMAGYTGGTTTLFGTDEPERVPIEFVSAPYFTVFGVAPAAGRTFRADEDAVPNRDLVVVLGHGLWKRRFGGDPSIVNKTIQLGPRSFTVIGIMPPGFRGITDAADLWLPFALSGATGDNRGNRGFQTVARLKPDVSIDAARADLDVISRQLEREYAATNDKRGVEVSPLSVETYGPLRSVVTTFMVAVVLVLLIACANVANLLIGRSEARQKEIAVRTALGAGKSRLMRQLITESLVLTGLGAAAGVALAQLAMGTIVANSPVPFPTFIQPRLSVTVALFTVAVAVITGLIVGLAPALHARSARLTDALKESARGSGGARSQRLRSALVIAEVALAIMLLVGAGMMIRSVQNLTAVDPGFDASRVLTLSAAIPRQPAPPAAPAQPGAPPPPAPPFVLTSRDLLDRVRAVPGVEMVSLASDIPLNDGGGSAAFYSAEGDATADAQTRPRAYVHRVTPQFFDTLRIPFKAGRTFAESDATADSTAVIVSEGVARRFWPGQEPIGKRIKLGPPESSNPWLTISGVVSDVKYRGLPQNPTPDPDLYFPALDRSPQNLIVRAGVDPGSLTGAIRTTIRAAHPGIVVYNVNPLGTLVQAQTSPQRFTTWTLGLFATTALVLSIVGIYGVMSYLVAQRRREFGIRLALGATRSGILRSVIGRGAMMIGAGLAIGVTGSLFLSQLLGTLLFGVGAADASSAVAVLVLVGVALVACGVPAIRATRVDPVTALRND
jgi:putative ABC transport system permease protein